MLSEVGGGSEFQAIATDIVSSAQGQLFPPVMEWTITDDTTDSMVGVLQYTQNDSIYLNVTCMPLASGKYIRAGVNFAAVGGSNATAPFGDTFSITAIYPGNANYAPSTSVPVALPIPLNGPQC
jgi:hypothetical protein